MLPLSSPNTLLLSIILGFLAATTSVVAESYIVQLSLVSNPLGRRQATPSSISPVEALASHLKQLEALARDDGVEASSVSGNSGFKGYQSTFAIGNFVGYSAEMSESLAEAVKRVSQVCSFFRIIVVNYRPITFRALLTCVKPYRRLPPLPRTLSPVPPASPQTAPPAPSTPSPPPATGVSDESHISPIHRTHSVSHTTPTATIPLGNAAAQLPTFSTPASPSPIPNFRIAPSGGDSKATPPGLVTTFVATEATSPVSSAE